MKWDLDREAPRTVAFALCGSFCSFSAVLPQGEALCSRGWKGLPILSASAATQDTRFGTASGLRQTLREMTGHAPLTTLQEVEPLGPRHMAQALVIAPATGTTMALLAAGISSTPVTLAALLQRRHYYFVPFGQDDSYKKPCSLKSDFSQLPDALEGALRGVQVQPVLL